MMSKKEKAVQPWTRVMILLSGLFAISMIAKFTTGELLKGDYPFTRRIYS